MQENRSFDTYFGTFPGADGIPMRNGVPAVCVPDPTANNCVRPYHDSNDRNRGGPHSAKAAVAAIDGGKMDGFVERRRARPARLPRRQRARVAAGGTEVMGYHDGRDLANYWRYARDFVLQDRMFEPNASWSLPQHLFMVSEWSAWCKRVGDPMSCENELQSPDYPPDFRSSSPRFRAPGARASRLWLDRLDLSAARAARELGLLRDGRDRTRLCQRSATIAARSQQKAKTPGIWNPLPFFDTVKRDNELGNIRDLRDFYKAAARRHPAQRRVDLPCGPV